MDIYQTKCCNKCNIIKPITEFHKDKSKKDEHRNSCKECENLRKQCYYAENKDTAKQNNKKCRAKSKEKYNAYKRKRRLENEIHAIAERVRALLGHSFRRNGYTKKSKTYDILGCSFDDLKIHLENQFVEGMNWDNRNEWHIDHIIPLSSAITEEEIIKLNHYTNLQPLWAIDNLQKGSKLL